MDVGEKYLEALYKAKTQVAILSSQLDALSNLVPEQRNWAAVGDLNHINKELEEVNQFLGWEIEEAE